MDYSSDEKDAVLAELRQIKVATDQLYNEYMEFYILYRNEKLKEVIEMTKVDSSFAKKIAVFFRLLSSHIGNEKSLRCMGSDSGKIWL